MTVWLVQDQVWFPGTSPTVNTRFEVVCKQLRRYHGEVRLPDRLTDNIWTLVQLSPEEGDGTTALAHNKQLLLMPDGSCVPESHPCFGRNWVSEREQLNMERQCAEAAKQHPDMSEEWFWPQWEHQTVRLTCPTRGTTRHEWRVTAPVVTLGLVIKRQLCLIGMNTVQNAYSNTDVVMQYTYRV